MIASQASFAYSNGHTTEERIVLKLTKKKEEDDELGIFGAEKYFKGVIDEELLRTSKSNIFHSNRPQEKLEEPFPTPKPKSPSSVRSESSWNSRRGFLVSNGTNRRKKTGVKSLLASFGCNCNDEDSVKVNDKVVHVKEPVKQPVRNDDLGQKTKSLSSKRADEDVNVKKFDVNETNFTFPVLNSSMADVKPEVEQGKKSLSLERKVNMLNWEGVTPRAEVLEASRNGLQNDTGSDASSDLFEIESFSTNENNSFLARQAIEKNQYAPSEVSVDWSVVTASVADFSNPEDSVVSRTCLKGSGILSGCKSQKAVRVSGDERCITGGGGGEKAGAVVAPTRREWSRRLDSTTPMAKIQADTKLIGVGLDLNRRQNAFGGARSIPRTYPMHASHSLYMQQQ